MYYGAQAKEILNRLEVTGTDGMKLARSLVRGYAGIARGVWGQACIAFLADQTTGGVLKLENQSWIYLDPQGTRIVAGSRPDRVIRDIARMGVLFHRTEDSNTLDEHEIAERLTNSARRVDFELSWRKRSFHIFPR